MASFSASEEAKLNQARQNFQTEKKQALEGLRTARQEIDKEKTEIAHREFKLSRAQEAFEGEKQKRKEREVAMTKAYADELHKLKRVNLELLAEVNASSAAVAADSDPEVNVSSFAMAATGAATGSRKRKRDTEICRHYLRHRNCSWGEGCKFAHVIADPEPNYNS